MKLVLNLMEMGLKKVGIILTILVLLSAATAVFADKPPKDLVSFVSQYPVIYDQKCDVPSQKMVGVECLIFAVDRNTIFLVLFTPDQKNITHIFLANKEGEKLLWSDSI